MRSIKNFDFTRFQINFLKFDPLKIAGAKVLEKANENIMKIVKRATATF